MPRPFLLAVLLIAAPAAWAQTQRATTESGRAVLLRPDGTWLYDDLGESEADEAASPARELVRPETAAELLRGEGGTYGLWVTKDWTRSREDGNEDAELELEHASGVAHAVTVFERTPFPVEMIAQIAIENARRAMEDVRETHRERRLVNGHEVLYVEYGGHFRGAIPFVYQGSFYSDERGTLQVISWTSEVLLAEAAGALNDIHSGIVIFEDGQ